MPRKSGYRRRYRKKSQFSKLNLYKKSSSKAQAGQIYSLNKKVGKMYKALQGDILRWELRNQAIYSWGATATPQNYYSETKYLGALTGLNYFKLKDLYVTLHLGFTYPPCTYSVNQSATPQVYLRFIMVQYTKSVEGVVSVSDIITNSTSSLAIWEPLKEGTGTKFKILRDRVYKIDYAQPVKDIQLHLRKYIKYKAVDGNIAKGNIQFFYCVYNSGAITDNWTNYGTNSYADVKVSYRLYYYTDKN